MTILGIGIDVVHLPRIASLLLRRKPARFASRILSPEEYSQWKLFEHVSDQTESVRFLAVRCSLPLPSSFAGLMFGLGGA